MSPRAGNPESAESNRPAGLHVGLVYLGLAAAIGAIYGQVIAFQFVDWDDYAWVSENPHVDKGMTWENFAWALGIHGPGQWHPLAWWLHQINCQIFGLAPGWHHAINVLIHVGATWAVLTALWRLTGDFWPSVLVATLFALHPVSVESVAWVSHLRDPLSALIGALVFLAYAAYVRQGGVGRYLLVMLLFTLGLMAKPILITLPCVLLLLDYWPLRRIGFGEPFSDQGASPLPSPRTTAPGQLGWLLLEKAPFVALAVASAWLSYRCQHTSNSVVPLGDLPLGPRLANVPQSYLFHLLHVFWPTNFAVMYPFPETFSVGQVTSAVVILLGLTAGAFYFGRQFRFVAVGWLWYVGMLVPVIGLMKLGAPLATTDHHAYFPLLGIYIAIAWLLREWVRYRPAWNSTVVGALAVLILGLASLTWRQVGVWRDGETLFRHALAVTRNNFVAQCQLGVVLYRLDRRDEAMALYRAALATNPGDAISHFNLGKALEDQGETDAAMQHYREALRLDPRYAIAHNNLGNLLVNGGKSAEALEHFQQALSSDPNLALAHNNLGKILAEEGKPAEALEHYQEALRLDPKLALAHNNLGNALAKAGRANEALEHYREALRLDPHFGLAHYNLGIMLTEQGATDEAIPHFREAVRAKPAFAEGYVTLGNALLLSGRSDEAINEYLEALHWEPNLASAHFALGGVLASRGKRAAAIDHLRAALQERPRNVSCRTTLGGLLVAEGKLDEAIQQLHEAVQIDPGYAAAHYNLAIALEQQGRFDEAIDGYRQALRSQPEMAGAHGNLGYLLARQGKLDEAIAHYREALRIRPQFVDALKNLGLALAAKEDVGAAIRHFQDALRLDPKRVDVLTNLAWIRAVYHDAHVRDGAEAVQLAERACALTGNKDPICLDVLAAAYGEAGRFDEAAATARAAVALATAGGDSDLAAQITSRITLYQDRRPFRGPAIR